MSSNVKRPMESGWITLEDWADLTETPWTKALAYANPKSKRTGKMFHAADVDKRSNQEVRVWWQAPNPVTGFRRPRLIPRVSPSGEATKPASHTSDESQLTPSHALTNAAPLQSSGRSSRRGSSGVGGA